MTKRKLPMLLRDLAIEVILYSILAIVYSLVVWKLLGDPLNSFFHDRRQVYAIMGLGLILLQGLFLDGVTSWLLNRLNLGRFE